MSSHSGEHPCDLARLLRNEGLGAGGSDRTETMSISSCRRPSGGCKDTRRLVLAQQQAELRSLVDRYGEILKQHSATGDAPRCSKYPVRVPPTTRCKATAGDSEPTPETGSESPLSRKPKPAHPRNDLTRIVSKSAHMTTPRTPRVMPFGVQLNAKTDLCNITPRTPVVMPFGVQLEARAEKLGIHLEPSFGTSSSPGTYNLKASAAENDCVQTPYLNRKGVEFNPWMDGSASERSYSQEMPICHPMFLMNPHLASMDPSYIDILSMTPTRKANLMWQCQ